MSAEVRCSDGRVWSVDLGTGSQIPFEDDLIGAALHAEERHRERSSPIGSVGGRQLLGD